MSDFNTDSPEKKKVVISEEDAHKCSRLYAIWHLITTSAILLIGIVILRSFIVSCLIYLGITYTLPMLLENFSEIGWHWNDDIVYWDKDGYEYHYAGYEYYGPIRAIAEYGLRLLGLLIIGSIPLLILPLSIGLPLFSTVVFLAVHFLIICALIDDLFAIFPKKEIKEKVDKILTIIPILIIVLGVFFAITTPIYSSIRAKKTLNLPAVMSAEYSKSGTFSPFNNATDYKLKIKHPGAMASANIGVEATVTPTAPLQVYKGVSLPDYNITLRYFLLTDEWTVLQVHSADDYVFDNATYAVEGDIMTSVYTGPARVILNLVSGDTSSGEGIFTIIRTDTGEELGHTTFTYKGTSEKLFMKLDDDMGFIGAPNYGCTFSITDAGHIAIHFDFNKLNLNIVQ